MDGFDSMFDLDGDGTLDMGERSLEMDYMMRAEAGDGDVDWDKDTFDDDGDDEFDEEDDW